jgi:hypothetical protein
MTEMQIAYLCISSKVHTLPGVLSQIAIFILLDVGKTSCLCCKNQSESEMDAKWHLLQSLYGFFELCCLSTVLFIRLTQDRARGRTITTVNSEWQADQLIHPRFHL